MARFTLGQDGDEESGRGSRSSRRLTIGIRSGSSPASASNVNSTSRSS